MPVASWRLPHIPLEPDTAKVVQEMAIAIHGLPADNDDTPIRKQDSHRKGVIYLDDYTTDTIEATWAVPSKTDNSLHKLGGLHITVVRYGQHVKARATLTLHNGQSHSVETGAHREPRRVLAEIWDLFFSDTWDTMTCGIRTDTDTGESTVYRWLRRVIIWAANIYVLRFLYSILHRFHGDAKGTFYWTDGLHLVLPAMAAVTAIALLRQLLVHDALHRSTRKALSALSA